MDVNYVFAGLVVANRDQAVDWYAKVIGRPPDMLPNDAEAAWQLTSSASAYLRADPNQAGRGVITLIVADLEAVLAEISGRGVAAAAVEDVPGAGRKATFTDPDGNTVELVELIGGPVESA
jgi:predicted enzyme related to lactoylglutathione lyase